MYQKIEEYVVTFFPEYNLKKWLKCSDGVWLLSIGPHWRYRISTKEYSYNLNECKKFNFGGLNSYDSKIYFDDESNLNILFSIIKEMIEIDLDILEKEKELKEKVKTYNNGKYISIYRDKKIEKIIE